MKLDMMVNKTDGTQEESTLNFGYIPIYENGDNLLSKVQLMSMGAFVMRAFADGADAVTLVKIGMNHRMHFGEFMEENK